MTYDWKSLQHTEQIAPLTLQPHFHMHQIKYAIYYNFLIEEAIHQAPPWLYL